MADPIKHAFAKVKEDILSLKEELRFLSSHLADIKRTIIVQQVQTDNQTDRQTDQTQNQTHRQIMQTDTDNQTDNYPPEASEMSISDISTGNRGVQTDRQTIRQTDRQILNTDNQPSSNTIPTQKFALIDTPQDNLTKIDEVSHVLNSLDSLKKEIRTQFKKLTVQEMLVFSTIYQLEDQGFSVDYPSIASKTNLSESAIRDYVQKLLKKGIPIAKSKENNKKVSLSIKSNLRRIASLETILTLREL